MMREDSLHGRAYARLSTRDRRSLVNHHLSFIIKICLFAIGM
jgi:hypothetical protein